jgi:predicted metal-dependent enzyme (double-stranded beta helix superfamily)
MQRPDENDAAYSRFCTYRDAPKTQRNLAEIAKMAGVSRQTIHQMANRYAWRERVSGFLPAEETMERRCWQCVLWTAPKTEEENGCSLEIPEAIEPRFAVLCGAFFPLAETPATRKS